MAKRLSPDDVTGILRSGDFDQLLGAVEDHELECKDAPYSLDQEGERFELAKDVSGMANGSGGSILIGVRTRRDPTLSGDIVSGVSPFVESLINIRQYGDVLRQWVYPVLKDLDIQWWPTKNDRARGIVRVLVTSGNAPHLVTAVPLPETGQTKGALFGYFERLRADVQPTSVQELRDRLKDGLRFPELNEQYQNILGLLAQLGRPFPPQVPELGGPYQEIEGVLVQPLRPSPPQVSSAAALQARTRAAVAAVGLEGKPRLTLSAVPQEAVEVPGLIDSRDSPVVRHLDEPPKLDPSGFKLDTFTPSRLIHGEFRRSFVSQWKLLEHWRDGTLLFVGAGDEEFLCWATRSSRGAGPIINNLVLTEVMFLFAELARLVYQESAPPPARVRYVVELCSTKDAPYSLAPFPVPVIELQCRKAPWSGDCWSLEFDQQTTAPGQIAFALLREIYAWFGFEADRIPYVDRSGPEPVVTPESIRPRHK